MRAPLSQTVRDDSDRWAIGCIRPERQSLIALHSGHGGRSSGASRRDALADLAKKLAERAMQEQKVVRLSPMSAHDRRVFHLTLKEMDGVNTRSEGEGLYRNLLIIPSQFG